MLLSLPTSVSFPSRLSTASARPAPVQGSHLPFSSTARSSRPDLPTGPLKPPRNANFPRHIRDDCRRLTGTELRTYTTSMSHLPIGLYGRVIKRMHEWSNGEVFVRNRADAIQHNDAFALGACQAETTPSTRPNPSLHMSIIQPAVDLVEAAARRPGCPERHPSQRVPPRQRRRPRPKGPHRPKDRCHR